MKFLIIAISLFLGVNSAKADEAVLEQTAKAVFSQVEIDLRELKKKNQLNQEQVKQLVTTLIFPYVDRKYFAYKVLGKNLEKLSETQRSEFVEVLSDKLRHNYAASLVNYNNEKIVFVTSKLAPSKKVANVIMKLDSDDKSTDLITKWRYAQKLDKWLMYDLIVEGVSLLQTKQREIGQSILSKGADQTLLDLQANPTTTK